MEKLQYWTDLAQRRQNIATGMFATSGALAGIGLIVLLISLGAGGDGEAAPDDGPMCTIGKRCGDACIAANETCHKTGGSGGGGVSVPIAITGGVVTGMAIPFLVGGFVARNRALDAEIEADKYRRHRVWVSFSGRF